MPPSKQNARTPVRAEHTAHIGTETSHHITAHHILSFLSPTQPQLTFPQPLTFRIPDQVSDLTSPHLPPLLITYLPNLTSHHLISSHPNPLLQ